MLYYIIWFKHVVKLVKKLVKKKFIALELNLHTVEENHSQNVDAEMDAKLR
jgi:hypothetical protein